MTSQPPTVKFKVVILGTQGVGKTCLFNRIANDKFSDKYESTVAGVFKGKFCSYHGQTIQVGIWDTVGTERYKSLNQLFYRDAKAAIVCYDICDARTWEDVKYWLSELRLHEEGCKIYLCGTKKDLVMEGHQQRAVQLEVTSKHAAGIQAKLFEVSSKTGDNVEIYIPEELKISRKCPVLKKGPKSKPETYHPFSIMPVVGKLFEALVYEGHLKTTMLQKIVDEYMESQEKLEQMTIQDGNISLCSAQRMKTFYCC